MESIFAGLKPKRLAFMVLCAVFLSCIGSAAEASPAWRDIKGYSECGGIDKNGELQEACGFTRAKKIGKAVGSCPKGSFFDLGTWACYSCPPSYNRNARSVVHEKACDKNVTNRRSPARLVGKATCPSGSVYDPRNGGECWSCPSGYGRTAAAVDKWNACGMIGRKAVSAQFKGKICPDGAFLDKRQGGECWSCPEDYNRTANAVTSANACIITLDFKPAIKESALTCEPGEIFDFVDGGTCWKCAEGETRTMNGVKGAKACRNKTMKWVVPTRTMYGLFGLGKGADAILAQIIAERTDVDAIVRSVAEGTGENAASALKLAWETIDTKPWESPYLPTILQGKLMAALDKPATQRSDSEKGLIRAVSDLVQWNRQFIAYQNKQAFDAWAATSKKFYEEKAKQMGAAVIYADNMMTPPDYNELIVASIQAGTFMAAPVGALSIPLFVKPVGYALLPFRKAAQKAAIQGLKVMTSSGGIPSSSAMAAASGPLVIAAAAAVILTLEMDKLLKMEEYEGKIRQAIDISNRPVDLKLLFQQENGMQDFTFHWASVLSANTQPSSFFKQRLAAYKNGTADKQITFPTINMNSATIAADTPDSVTADTVRIETIPTTSVVVGANSNTNPNATRPFVPTATKPMLAAIKRQTTQPAGAMRFELTSAPGLCLSKGAGTTTAMVLGDCNAMDTLWFKFDRDKGNVVFADKYCLRLASEQPKSDTAVYLNDCGDTNVDGFELTKRGLIKSANSNNCVGVDRRQSRGSAVVSLNCSSFSPRQIWRPWAVN